MKYRKRKRKIATDGVIILRLIWKVRWGVPNPPVNEIEIGEISTIVDI